MPAAKKYMETWRFTGDLIYGHADASALLSHSYSFLFVSFVITIMYLSRHLIRTAAISKTASQYKNDTILRDFATSIKDVKDDIYYWRLLIKI